jgi:uncharacterized protein with FMN-binding domain
MKKRMLSAAALAALVSSAALGCGAQATQAVNDAATGSVDGSPVTATTVSAATSGGYVDGTYTGDSVGTSRGAVQVKVVVESGALTDVQFLAYPTGHESDGINSQATPILVQEAIEAQSADVDVVSGATMTSEAFMESLDSALSQAL